MKDHVIIKKPTSVGPTCKPMSQKQINTLRMMREAIKKYGGTK